MCRPELCLVIVCVVAIASPVTPVLLNDPFFSPNSVVGRSMKLLQQQCPKRVFNQRIFDGVPVCLKVALDDSPPWMDISNAIKAKNWVRVFKNVCKTFPVFETCLRPIVDLIDDCTYEGDKVNTMIDSVENFFCGSFSLDTLECIMEHEQRVSTCMEHNSEGILTMFENAEVRNEEKSYCGIFSIFEKCQEQVLGICNDPNLEYQVTFFEKTLSEALKCSKQTSGAEYPTPYLLLLNSILVAGVVMFL
ncbi:unnamed protein product [Allacma fusca]|uniref:Uncharacterized protein n=1 Tax=Allacma fusca TaxID=39272 RepID=A0A8J2P027_9HEXA|nr:unnamed protein product [Allacma fusca]